MNEKLIDKNGLIYFANKFYTDIVTKEISNGLINKADIVHTHENYVEINNKIPNRILVTNSIGEVGVKSDLNSSQLDTLKNVSGDIQSQLNSKSDIAHIHTEYLTIEDLNGIEFSGKAEDVIYNPANANLESLNVKNAIDEVDNKIEEQIAKSINDKSELKKDISDTNVNITNNKRDIDIIKVDLTNKSDINHTHSISDHIHEDIDEKINININSINVAQSNISRIDTTITEIPMKYSQKSHIHQDLIDSIDAINLDITDHTHKYLETMVDVVDKKTISNGEQISTNNQSISAIQKSINDSFPTFANKTHLHPEIEVKITEHTHQDLKTEINQVGESINGLSNIYAVKLHEHDEKYALKIHSHDFNLEHNHDGVYSPTTHLHSIYADTEHYHNDIYSPKVHTHTGEFAPTVHTHGDLANKEHTHKEFADFIDIDTKNIANGVAGLDTNAKIPIELIPDIAKAVNIIGTKSERENLTSVSTGVIFRETDTGDSYIYSGTKWELLSDADWSNVKLQWNNIEGIPTEFNPTTHTHNEYSPTSHEHTATNIKFADGEDLQAKLENGSLGSPCNIHIGATPPIDLPIGGLWVDTSSI